MITCDQCGEPFLPGQERYTLADKFDDEDNWIGGRHASCHSSSRAAARALFETPLGFVVPEPRVENNKPGDRLVLQQASWPQTRYNKGIHRRPRRHISCFLVAEDGTAAPLDRSGVAPRRFLREKANVLARNGSLPDFIEGFNDGLDPSSPEPGDNRGRDYASGFELGRDPVVVDEELYRTKGRRNPSLKR